MAAADVSIDRSGIGGWNAPAPDALAAPQRSGPRVWAIGGGKGGVGKSIISASLAISFARRGSRCAVVDADLGGANLHTLLGVPFPRHTLSHFFKNEVPDLADVMTPGPVRNLWLVSAAQGLYEMANPKHGRKEKLLRHIRRLDVDDVVLDLGAGSAFNVLDFFLAADRGVLVVVPEPTSIENAYSFLKSAFFRALRGAARHVPVREALLQVLADRSRDRVRSPRELMEEMADVDPVAAAELQSLAKTFAPALIVNQARTAPHRRIGQDIALACETYLGASLQYLGALARDESVRSSVAECRPVLERHPGCAFALDLDAVVKRLWDEDEPEPAPSFEDSDCALRRGRTLYGPQPLALAGLTLEETRWGETPLVPDAYTPPPRPASPPPVSRPRANESLPALDLDAPGVYLRRCRELRGLSLVELTNSTRIRCLEAIEAQDFARLPPGAYVRSMVQGYAETLGIGDAATLAAAYAGLQRLNAGGSTARRRRWLRRGGGPGRR